MMSARWGQSWCLRGSETYHTCERARAPSTCHWTTASCFSDHPLMPSKFVVTSLTMVTAFVGVCSIGCTPEDPDPFATTTTNSTGNETTGDGDGDPSADCGDGVVQVGEECDLGSQNTESGQCTPSCEIASCGDGLVYEGLEECDDGNSLNTDACVTGCQLATCGDGFTQDGVEVCDDGNLDDGDACNAMCLPGSCSDGILQEGEQCDDGDVDTSDECPACQFAYCGDGYVQVGIEACDDGNLVSNDACTYPNCTHNFCGDGVLFEGQEECDDGNAVGGDACTLECTTAFCGDGVKQVGVEECDDGNDVDDDFCTNACISLLYFVEGVQTNVDEGDLGGWEECWSGTFGGYYPDLSGMILGQQCTGSKLLIGCRPVDSPTFTLLAMGERADVLFDTGNGNITHDANGVSWYYSGSYSMGFAELGTGVSRNSCDTSQVSPTLRMCWHTSGNAITNGYRCGTTYPQNNYEKVIMQAD
jgi:cysteine-rich repeat protein